jgi:hypothetical protein
MISTSNLPVQNSGHDLHARLASSSKSQPRALAAVDSKTCQIETHDPGSDNVRRPSQAPTGDVSPAATKNLTLALSPMEDKAQASVATQSARAFILAHPSAAILAQANAHSQSAQRLLQ